MRQPAWSPADVERGENKPFHILKGQMEGLGKIYCSPGLEDKGSVQVRSLCAGSRVNSLPGEEEEEADVTQKSPGPAVFITLCCVPACTQRKGERQGHCQELRANSECFKPLPVNERFLILDVSLSLHCFLTWLSAGSP